ncbi:unnamed protein product, partial [Ectocarpus sp. 4 AP-2014]
MRCQWSNDYGMHGYEHPPLGPDSYLARLYAVHSRWFTGPMLPGAVGLRAPRGLRCGAQKTYAVPPSPRPLPEQHPRVRARGGSCHLDAGYLSLSSRVTTQHPSCHFLRHGTDHTTGRDTS